MIHKKPFPHPPVISSTPSSDIRGLFAVHRDFLAHCFLLIVGFVCLEIAVLPLSLALVTGDPILASH